MTELRSYQREAVDAFLGSDGHATLAMAPGSGKTIIACAIIRELRMRNFQENRSEKLPHSNSRAFRALVIVPTLELLDQWTQVLAKEGIKAFNVVVETYAMTARIIGAGNEEWFEGFDAIVFDEMHHLAESGQWQRLLIPAYKARYALGLSATPPTDEDNLALRVMPVVYTRTYLDGLDSGYAAPIEVRPVGIQLTDDERKRYAELTEMIRGMIARWGADNYHNKPYGKDQATGETIWGATLTTERLQLIANATHKFVMLAKTIREINALGERPARILVWSGFVDTLEHAKMFLDTMGITSQFIHGGIPKKERKTRWAAWGTEFQVLLTAKVASEGIDYPDLDVGIIIAGSKTTRENVQRIGRLLRSRENKTAKLWVLFAERTAEEKLVYLADQIAEA